MAEKSRLLYVSGGIFSLIKEFSAVKDKFNRYEEKNSNSDTVKDDLDKICPEDDCGSLYVSDEIFLKLMDRVIKRQNDNQQ